MKKSFLNILSVLVSLSLIFPVLFGGAGQTSASTIIVLTSGTTWTVPSDWNSANNTIEVIGGGGGGQGNAALYQEYGGGGGGYSESTNVVLTPGTTVGINVGLGGTAGSAASPNGGMGTSTWLCNSTSNCSTIGGTAVVVGANGGNGGTAGSGGAGGSTTGAVGTTHTFSGGNGGTNSGSLVDSSTGGGGAGGPHGNGANGGPTTFAYSSTGGGGGGAGAAFSNGGGGAQGIIVITYTPYIPFPFRRFVVMSHSRFVVSGSKFTIY